MRVYLPSTLPALGGVLRAGEVGPAPLDGFAVTPALREAYAIGDEEELEYAAMMAAARASLRLLGADPEASPRRVVLAADIAPGSVKWATYPSEPSTVVVTAAVPVSALASGHVDAAEAETDVRAAADAIPGADLGDEDASFTVDGAEGHELLWYATQELADLSE